jgi:hypothetical protein
MTVIVHGSYAILGQVLSALMSCTYAMNLFSFPACL